MKAQSRLDLLPKKDREAILHLKDLDTYRENSGDLTLVFKEDFARFLHGCESLPKQAHSFKSFGELFASSVFFMASRCIQGSILNRLLTDDPQVQVQGIRLATRLLYVADLGITPAYSGGCDCLHVWNILEALAVCNYPVIEAYLARHPGPASKGHPFTVLLCNAVTAILTSDVASYADLLDRLKSRPAPNYDKAMLLCLVAAIEGNSEGITGHLQTMFKSHRTRTINDGMKRFVCLPAHGLFNLALDVLKRNGQPPPPIPESPLWDQAFHDAVHQADTCRVDWQLQTISATLAKWIEKLPRTVDSNQVASLIGSSLQEAQQWLAPYPVPKKKMPACPFCGKPLKTEKAQQCFRCGADWHDPH
jgi:hypothetical protein